MPKNKIDAILEKQTTRRDFLKMAAKGTATVAVGATVLSFLGGCSDSQEAMGERTGIPLPQGMLVVDNSRCIGCGRCEVACTLQNQGEVIPSVSSLHIDQNLQFGENLPRLNYRYGQGIMGSGELSAGVCHQCRAPFCANACPKQAILPDKSTGARTVNKDICDGCGHCVEACPFDMMALHPQTNIASKCITCGSCVNVCPTAALSVQPWQDFVG